MSAILIRALPMAQWIRSACPSAISERDALQFAFCDLVGIDEYPLNLEPALQRAILFHVELTLQ